MKCPYRASMLALVLLGSSALAQSPPARSRVAEEEPKAMYVPPAPCPPQFSGVPECPTCEPGPYPLYPWIGVEYLYWAVKEPRLQEPLATTSISGTGGGIIGDPDTRELLGHSSIDYDGLNGVRLSGGWYDARLNLIVDLVGFGFDLTKRAAEESDGLPVIARPFLSSEDLTQSAFLVAFPDAFSGAINVESFTRLWGVELNLGCHLCHDEDWNIDLLIGCRYMQLEEALEVRDSTVALADGLGFFLGEEIDTGDERRRFDLFEAKNRFYGPQIGIRSEAVWGPLFLKFKGMMAVGQSNNRFDVLGHSTLVQGGVVTNGAPGGLLALPSNMGHFHRDDIIAVPQVEISAGFQIADSLRFFVGYGFMYWSEVIRPTDQLPRSINPNYVPTSPTFGLGGVPAPGPSFDQSGYWVHGLQAGMAVRF